MSEQPVWKTLWKTYCTWLHVDETGQYDPELTVAQEDEDAKRFYVYRVVCEVLREVRFEGSDGSVSVFLVPKRYIGDPYVRGEKLPHFIGKYEPWFVKYLADITRSADHENIRRDLCGGSSQVARAYQSIYGHFGYDNGDGYPRVFTYHQFYRLWDGKPPGPEKPKWRVQAHETRTWRLDVEIEAEDEEEAEKLALEIPRDDPRWKEDLDQYDDTHVDDIDEVEEKE